MSSPDVSNKKAIIIRLIPLIIIIVCIIIGVSFYYLFIYTPPPKPVDLYSTYSNKIPTIDGIYDPDEWNDTTKFSRRISDELGEDSVIYNIWVKNNDTHLFMCIHITDVHYNLSNMEYLELEIAFGPNANDIKYITWSDGYMDCYWASAGVGYFVYKDGQKDGYGNFTYGGPELSGNITFELVMPLKSGDSHDYGIERHSSVAFWLEFCTATDESTIPSYYLTSSDWSDFENPGYIHIN